MLFVALTLAFSGVVSQATYEKFFLIIFENHGYNQVLANSYWQSLVKDSLLATTYYAVSHPSQPNYVAQIAGTFSDCTSNSACNLPRKNLVDLLEEKGISWKTYQEAYNPLANGACNLISNDGTYYRKHNPFMSYTDITTNLARCQKIVNSNELLADVQTNNLPQWGYYTPDINNDSHDQDLNYSGAYFQNWLKTYYLAYPEAWAKTLFMVTFDEDQGAENNHVVTFFRGPGVPVGIQCGGSFDHYSILKFTENNFGLGSLGTNDVTARDFATITSGC